jgi:hypothetical protein
MSAFEVGQFAVSQWGYDQTNTDFYQVVKKTEKSVWLKPVQVIAVEATGPMSDSVEPIAQDHTWKTQVICKRIKKYEDDEHSSGWYSSEIVRPWDGQAKHRSWYA